MKKCLVLLLLAITVLYKGSIFGQDLSFRKINTDGGLSHNTVYTIVQDAKGFMWFGTREGLNRYDSYTVKNYYFKNARTGTTTNRISCLLSLDANIYIGTDNGLYKYEEPLDKVSNEPLLKNQFPILSIAHLDSSIYVGANSGFYRVGKSGEARLLGGKRGQITAIGVLPQKTFLLASGKLLEMIDESGKTLKRFAIKSSKTDFTVFNIWHEKQITWLCTNFGLHQLNEQTGQVTRVIFTENESAESNTVRAITGNGKGQFYIGTENGLYVYDPITHRSLNYNQTFDNSPKTLNDKAIYSAFTAKDGSVWLGTYFGGINYIPSISYGFKGILASEQPGRLNGKAISQMMEDKDHNIWVGTEDGGISIYHPKSRSFININKNSKPFRLAINNVHAIYNDNAGSIWVGTFLGGLHRFEEALGRTTIYTNHPGDTTSLASDQVYAVYRDSKNTLWIGTQHGLNTFDYRTGKFHAFNAAIFASSFIYDMVEDADGDMWFCTRWDGLIRYVRKKGKFTRYMTSTKPNSLPSNQVISVYKDSDQKLWFGTLDGGACRYNAGSDDFTVINTDNGLPNNNVYGILEDDSHQLWFSTNRGLACYNKASKTFVNYDNRYSLPSNQFNFKSFLKASDGTLYFGTVHGLCYFDPQKLEVKQQHAPLRFTGFQVFNRPVEPGEGSILSKPIDDVGVIDLQYAQNVFSISFAALNYSNVRGNNYTYYLDGLETKWNTPSGKNQVTYTSLSPGSYTFHLRALDVAGRPVSTERLLVINVLPPFYRSKPAFVFYAFIIILIIWLYTRFVKFLHEKKMELQVERMEKEKTAALTQHRLNFFTFISHEFKTPLTLIIASVEKFMSEHNAEPGRGSELAVIKNNASRLSKMIHQLMDFRTIETDHSAVKLSHNDLVKFTHETVASFLPLAQNKGLKLLSSSGVRTYFCYFDVDKMEHILFNILSNAIKNSTEGSVSLDLNFIEARGESRATFVIRDTGRGMTKKEIERVFETFYKGIDNDEGSGVGMALVKNLVAYLNGEISLQSEPGKGTSVHLSLPITGKVAGHQVTVTKTLPGSSPRVEEALTGNTDAVSGLSGQTILVVEDNKELQIFLAKHLGRSYNVIPASNGLSGWTKLTKQTPDLVLSDIRMPKMDGIELCRKIKSDVKYNHIPVVLLSDNTRENVKLDGLDGGADAYLAKPFNLKELDLLVANMIRSRVKLREQLLDMSKFGLDKLPRNNKDQEFLANLGAVLEGHFADQKFTVEEMAASLNISRTLLHINLKKILNKSATQLLNEYRLKKAVLMLRGNLPINEAGYYSGYSDPNYFSRIFKKYYGVSPGAFKSDPDKYPNVV